MQKQMGWLGLVAVVCLGLGCPSGRGQCNAGLTACEEGVCADTTSDGAHCGACGVVCATGQACQDSACVCQAGSTVCGGVCAVLASSAGNCGACGHACASGEVCESGQCQAACSGAAATQCGSSCVDTQADALNCGGCGSACASAQSCHAGLCSYDVVAACFSSGTVVGVQDATAFKGPAVAVGGNPQALGALDRLVLVADGLDQSLRQVNLSTNQVVAGMSTIGLDPTEVLVELPYVYVVNSTGHTLQILQVTAPDAAALTASQLDTLTTVGELDLGNDTVAHLGPKVNQGGTESLYLPFFGSFSNPEAGQRVVRVDVTDKTHPQITRTYALDFADLHPYPNAMTYPCPSAAVWHHGALYLALSNLDAGFNAAGAGLVARLDVDTGDKTLISLGSDVCADASDLVSLGDALVVSCSGLSDYSGYPVVTTTLTSLVLLDDQDQRVAAYVPHCPSAGGAGSSPCADPSLQRVAAVGQNLYVGDTASRLFVVRRDGSALTEVRGYGVPAGPLQICPSTPNADSLVSDVVAIP